MITVVPHRGADTPPSVTFDAAQTGSGGTLSGGNLTASQTSGTFSTRATLSYSTAKVYWECLSVTQGGAGDSNCVIALCQGTHDKTTGMGTDTVSIGYYNSGKLYVNNANVFTAAAFSASNVIRAAWDGTAKLLWISVAGGNWNNSGAANPATGAGGFDLSALTAPLFAGASYASLSGGSCTVNFGHTAFTYTLPAGFSPYGS